jgi:hypothetical protein
LSLGKIIRENKLFPLGKQFHLNSELYLENTPQKPIRSKDSPYFQGKNEFSLEQNIGRMPLPHRYD